MANPVYKAQADAEFANQPFDRQAAEQQKESIWNTFQMSYSACYQAIRKVYGIIGLVATKKTHAPRGTGAREANAGGYVPRHLCTLESAVVQHARVSVVYQIKWLSQLCAQWSWDMLPADSLLNTGLQGKTLHSVEAGMALTLRPRTWCPSLSRLCLSLVGT